MSTLSALLRVIGHRWVAFVCLFLLLAIGATTGAYLKKPSFESSVKLLLNTDTMPLSLSRAELPQINGGSDTTEAVNTLTEILTSRQLMAEVVDNLGPEAFKSAPPSNRLVHAVLGGIDTVTEYLRRALARAGLITIISPRDEMIGNLQGRLQVYHVRQSPVLVVAMTWPNPVVAEQTLNELLALLLDRVAALNGASAEQDLFAQQAKASAAALEQAQTHLRSLQADYDVINPTVEIVRLNDRMFRLEQAQDRQAPTDGPVIVRSPEMGTRMDDLLRRISALEIARAGALALSTDSSAAVREVDAQLSAAHAEYEKETQRLQAAYATDQQRLDRLLAVEDDFIAAQRNADLATEGYRAYRQAAADRNVMRLQQERLRIRIIDPPKTSAAPTGPSRLVLVVLALLGALSAAILIILALDRLGRRGQGGRGEDGNLVWKRRYKDDTQIQRAPL